MTSKTAMILFMLGLVLTMFGVGGVESSISNLELLAALAVSVVGLGVMYCGVLGIRAAESYDERY